MEQESRAESRRDREHNLRQAELLNLTDNLSRQVREWDIVQEHLKDWMEGQGEALKNMSARAVDAFTPHVQARSASMVSAFETDLRAMLERLTLQQQEQAAAQAGIMSSSMSDIRGQADEWLWSLHYQVESTAALWEEYTDHVRDAQQRSQHLVASLADAQKELYSVHLQLSEDVEWLHELRLGVQEATEVISEAATLLNSTVHNQRRAQLTMLHWMSWVMGGRSEIALATVDLWFKQAGETVETRMRE